MPWINISPTTEYAPSGITNIIYIMCKIKKLKISLPENITKDLDFLYNFFSLRLKLLLFIAWDINDYIGNKNKGAIKCLYDESCKTYSIGSDLDFFDWGNFEIDKPLYDLPFYDPENNMEFFDRLYLIIGFVPFNENPLELPVYSYILVQVKSILENVESYLDALALDNSIKWSRGWHYYITENEEKEVQDWIIKFLNDTKEEWKASLKIETIEYRNWKLLNNIENLVIKK